MMFEMIVFGSIFLTTVLLLFIIKEVQGLKEKMQEIIEVR